MEIWHRITFSGTTRVDAYLDTIGMAYKKNPLPGERYTLRVDIAESNPRWQHIASLAQRHKALDMCDTLFDMEEVRQAEWLRLSPTFELGYPQPEKEWMRTQSNYANHCPRCGVHFGQTAPFRLAGEPDLGKRHFMTLAWTYELFASNRIFDILEKCRVQGYERWPAILHQSDEPSRSISQIHVSGIAKPGLIEIDQMSPTVCANCGRTKYSYHKKGLLRFRRDALLTGVDIQRTFEWLGSGHFAFREFLVSGAFAKLILDNGWLGVTLKPLLLL